VKAGQLIVLIDERPYRANVAQAEANQASAQAQIEQVEGQQPLLEANFRAAQAVAAATAANLAQANRDVARQARLLSGGSSSEQQLETIQTSRAQLQAQLHQNQAQADAVARQIDLLAAQRDQAQAALRAAQAGLRLAQINLGYTHIVAPNDGAIATRQVLPGQFIAAGGAAAGLGDRQLQGNAAYPRGGGRSRDGDGRYLSGRHVPRPCDGDFASLRFGIRAAAAG
jgi:membrane fusion protein (multidrug efflux system)